MSVRARVPFPCSAPDCREPGEWQPTIRHESGAWVQLWGHWCTPHRAASTIDDFGAGREQLDEFMRSHGVAPAPRAAGWCGYSLAWRRLAPAV